MNINIKIDNNVNEGTIYLIPTFIKCKHCGHEIPILFNRKLTEMIDDNGGCGKRSTISDYAKNFGVIKNVGV